MKNLHNILYSILVVCDSFLFPLIPLLATYSHIMILI